MRSDATKPFGISPESEKLLLVQQIWDDLSGSDSIPLPDWAITERCVDEMKCSTMLSLARRTLRSLTEFGNGGMARTARFHPRFDEDVIRDAIWTRHANPGSVQTLRIDRIRPITELIGDAERRQIVIRSAIAGRCNRFPHDNSARLNARRDSTVRR